MERPKAMSPITFSRGQGLRNMNERGCSAEPSYARSGFGETVHISRRALTPPNHFKCVATQGAQRGHGRVGDCAPSGKQKVRTVSENQEQQLGYGVHTLCNWVTG